MNYALISLIALLVAILISIVKPKINIGVISIAFALLIGYFLLGMKEKEVAALFPSSLFLMVLGVTTLFGVASQNGTLDRITYFAIKLAKGKPAFLPIIFFLLTFIVSAIGPGNIASVAIIAPVAMVVASKAKLNPFLMAIVVCTGANAGAFSPVAPTGVIAIGLMNKIGANGNELGITVFLAAAAMQSLTALLAYLIFKGYKGDGGDILAKYVEEKASESKAISKVEIITFIAIITLIVGVIIFKLPISLTAFTIASILLLINSADGEEVLKSVPWETIVLVTGVSVLIGILDKTGGLDLATSAIARVTSESYINSVLALVTGGISAYSSSSGVVMPAFVPLIPGLIDKLGGGDVTRMVIAVCVGSHMVDVSPLSTLGALCIASYPVKSEKPQLFKKLLVWGMAMAFVGALLSFIFLDLL